MRFPRKRLNENSRAAELPHTLIEVVGGFRRAFVPASSPARPKRRPFPPTRLAQTAATFTWCCGPLAFTRSQKFLTRGLACADFTMRLESGTGRSDAFTDRNRICWKNASFRTHHLSILTGWRLDVPKIEDRNGGLKYAGGPKEERLLASDDRGACGKFLVLFEEVLLTVRRSRNTTSRLRQRCPPPAGRRNHTLQCALPALA